MVFVSQTIITREILSMETDTVRLPFKQRALRDNDKVLVLRHHQKQDNVHPEEGRASSNIVSFMLQKVDIQFQK